jgi:hypothetical protein
MYFYLLLENIFEGWIVFSIIEIQSEGFKGKSPKLNILYIIKRNVIVWKKQYIILYCKIEYS